jgi:hypothetical protein
LHFFTEQKTICIKLPNWVVMNDYLVFLGIFALPVIIFNPKFLLTWINAYRLLEFSSIETL